MNTSLIVRLFAAVGVCVGLAQAAVAHDPNAARTDSVWIFSDRYIASEHVLPNPVRQDARVQPTRLQTIRLDVCEPSTPRQLSTSYFFRDFHLEIRRLPTGHSSCTVETAAYAMIVGSGRLRLSPNEDADVDGDWRD